ncbi:MAG: hypothetical protein J5693_06370 [Bacteroidales bacterium]|nr:hypothetical protein [Bacteroidales bacterium]
MKKTLTRILILAALCVSVASCIKDTTTYQYMKGKISFDIPDYIYAGDVVELTAGGITTPEDPTYGWVISTIQTDTLYAPKIVVKFPSTPASYTVKALAYHPDYIVESVRKDVVTVDTTHLTGSLKGVAYNRLEAFTDPRDGRGYRYATIGNLDWFAENLAWEGAGYVYASSSVLNHVFGRHYTWEETKDGICPDGWRVPTNADWENLGSTVCGSAVSFDADWSDAATKLTPNATFNGNRFWPFSVNNTHKPDFDFFPLPCGYMQTNDGAFYGLETYGMWWSATEYNADQAYYRYIYWDSADFRPGYTSKSGIALNVRCVRSL